jgi:GNAT superfamily N-acetyltransferase
MPLRTVTTRADDDLRRQSQDAFRGEWPEFIFHDKTSNELSARVGETFAEYDLLLVDDDEVVAGGWGVPLCWDMTIADLPDGYDGSLVRSLRDLDAGAAVDTLVVMAAAVKSGRQGQGLAGAVLTALRSRAAERGLTQVLAPVRPTLKTRYPLTSMADFATWTRDDGLHLDPWIRTHQRLGATVLAVAERSMVITGTVNDWASWAAMAFPQSGDYIVPGALDVVRVDAERDQVTYVESNLWMRHS